MGWWQDIKDEYNEERQKAPSPRQSLWQDVKDAYNEERRTERPPAQASAQESAASSKTTGQLGANSRPEGGQPMPDRVGERVPRTQRRPGDEHLPICEYQNCLNPGFVQDTRRAVCLWHYERELENEG